MKVSPSSLLLSFLSVAEVAFAVTIIVLIADQLWPGNGYLTICNDITGVCATGYYEGVCLLTNNSVNVCAYGYAASAIGGIVSLVCIFAPCMPAMVACVLCLINSLWYLAWSITLTVYNSKVSDSTSVVFPDGYPRGHYRNIVIAVSWTMYACAAVSVLLAAKMRMDAKTAKPAEGGQAEEYKMQEGKGEIPLHPPVATV
ncbi:hypothetical protein ACK3TF_003282 [Chlorella vulgaris]